MVLCSFSLESVNEVPIQFLVGHTAVRFPRMPLSILDFDMIDTATILGMLFVLISA